MPAATASTAAAVPANRAGLRDGQVSELSVIVPLKEGGAARLRTIFDGAGGRFESTSKVGSVHDMRFVFFDKDTKLLFASAYDGDWESYINDFATCAAGRLTVCAVAGPVVRNSKIVLTMFLAFVIPDPGRSLPAWRLGGRASSRGPWQILIPINGRLSN